MQEDRKRSLRKALYNFLGLFVLGLIMYPIIPPAQRRGAYRVYFVIVGLAVAAVIAMLIVALVMRWRKAKRP